ncbi:outer membrane porin, putative [Shewanella sp. MR-4]|uniref:porin n=1 Tax=Shewanella sp. (strain MR-4) TaxID=60480 RepID=UPI00005E51E8|nr:porin [Shewanella sp. MR-4]ABI40295.1 outer membrane porin, putative [Shewanella sp. MR-4]
MKKNLLATAIAASLAFCSFSSQADGPEFYGHVDLSITDSEKGYAAQNQKDGTVLENNFTWVGVKGSESVSPYFDIIYQMEFGVENFDNSNKTFNARNTFLGVRSVAGTVLVGRNDTVFKASEGGFDLFGNTNADIDLLLAGQTRSADGISYYSPKIADLITLNATYLMSDNYDQRDSQGNEVYSQDQMYALSATLGDKTLKTHNYYVAAAYNDGIDNIEAYRGVAQAKFGDFLFGAIYQHSEHIDDRFSNLSGDTYFVNAAYLMDDLKLKLVYGKDDSGLGKYVSRMVGSQDSANLEQVSDVDLQQLTLGADYRLSTKTMVYGHYTRFDGDLMLAGTKQDLDDNLFTVGLRIDF